ncbi:MAG: VanZ family protein [Bacilli bacterium]|nr:VanZ family protein [Bacilli bacterium]
MNVLVDFVALIIIYFWKFYKKWKEKGRDVLFINTIMYIYLSFVLYFTLMPILTRIPFLFFNQYPYEMNLIPFVDVLNGRGDFIRQVALNVIMLTPFGFLMPLTNKKNTKFLKVIFYTFLVSLVIEVLQPFSGRLFDVTDIITNVTGGIVGYIMYLIFKPLTTKILNYIGHR